MASFLCWFEQHAFLRDVARTNKKIEWKARPLGNAQKQ